MAARQRLRGREQQQVETTLAGVYARYNEALRASRRLDFDDLLVETVAMLETSAEMRGKCHARWCVRAWVGG